MNLYVRRNPQSLATSASLGISPAAAPFRRHASNPPPATDSPRNPLDPFPDSPEFPFSKDQDRIFAAKSAGSMRNSVAGSLKGSARVPSRRGLFFIFCGPFKNLLLGGRQNASLLHFYFQNRMFSSQSTNLPEYEMPSVTWGVIQGRKEKLVSRVIISDYLKSLGIIPDELEHLELPSTVEVMREREEFLQRLGLTIDDMNEYPLMLGCSARKNMIPVLGYLEKIGIQRSKLGEFVENYPQVLHASVVVELVPVVKFLRDLDVERHDIPYVLQKYPELLGFKLEGTMSTSVAYLVGIGVRPRDIGPMVTQYPYFLGTRVGTMIKPLVEYLISLGILKMILARMIEKRPDMLGYDLEDTVKPNMETLLNFGIRKEAIPLLVAQYPQIFGLPLKAKLSSQQYFFTLKLKIDPDGFARVIEKMPQIASLNRSVILKPVEFLRGRAIPVEDVAKVVVKCPQLLALRVELMKNTYYFFKSEMNGLYKSLWSFSSISHTSWNQGLNQGTKSWHRKGLSVVYGGF